jgi:hypothetical protein
MVYKGHDSWDTTEDLKEVAKKFANNEIHNNETLNCIISLDEKFFSPKK